MNLVIVLLGLPVLVQAGGCRTESGAVCVSPFIYEGSTRSACITTNDPEGRLWCSTATNQSNHHIIGNWGHCAPGCVGEDGGCVTSSGQPGQCMQVNLCIGLQLKNLQENMCGEGGGKVCCQPLSTNLRIDFSPAEVNLENFVTEDEDLEIEKLFREVEEEVKAEEKKLSEIGLRFGILPSSPSAQALPREPAFVHNKFNKPRKESNLLDRSSNILIKVAKKITQSSGIGLRSGLDVFSSRSVRRNCPWLPVPTCNPAKRFRSHDGTCNNLVTPNYGRTGTPYQRILLPEYGRGSIDVPRKRSSDDFELPSGRRISNKLTGGRNSLDRENTMLVMQFGQFIDHDITHTPIYESTDCCKSKSRFPTSFDAERCYPIRVERSDEFWRGGTDCMEFSRSLSSPDLDCKLLNREQLNQVSHWLDGSNIYGSTEEESSHLRAADGLLKISGKQENNLPSCGRTFVDIDACDACSAAKGQCFFAGDSRVNEQPNLIVMHTIFLREHNRLVNILSSLNPQWDGERLYEEARRINVAQYQHIIYKEWLPIVLGNNMMRLFGLFPLSRGFSTDYQDSFDPRINNEFASAAFRFGHSLISGSFVIKPLNSAHQVLNLRDTFFKPVPLNSSDMFAGFVRGLAEEETRAWDSNFVADIRNHLFESSKNTGGLDLVAMNIQRGRDHGVPGYIKYVEICGERSVKSWDDLGPFMEPENIKKLRSVYKDVEDVDLFVGGFLEKPHEDSMIGLVFKCIIGDQFARLKKGDRFFYDLGSDPNTSFSEAQLQLMRTASLARILCENSEIGSIQPFPLKMPINQINSKRSCEELISIKPNWNVFKE